MPEISLRSIRRLMRKTGADRVSREAIEVLRDLAEEYITKVSQIALELAEHAKRKTIQKEDIIKANKLLTQK